MLELDAVQVGTACLCIHLCKEMVLPVRDGQNIDIFYIVVVLQLSSYHLHIISGAFT